MILRLYDAQPRCFAMCLCVKYHFVMVWFICRNNEDATLFADYTDIL